MFCKDSLLRNDKGKRDPKKGVLPNYDAFGITDLRFIAKNVYNSYKMQCVFLRCSAKRKDRFGFTKMSFQ